MPINLKLTCRTIRLFAVGLSMSVLPEAAMAQNQTVRVRSLMMAALS